LIARVAANGTLVNASPEVSIRPHVRRSGQYVLDFGSDISACAPVGTARNPKPRAALARQVYLALGGDSRSLRVSVNDGTTRAVDHAFSLIVTCDESPKAVYPSSDGFFNLTTIPGVADCALTATWFEPEPGATPSNQGYVSTWARSRNTAVVQTKNGGYGVATGFGVDLVATCPSS
jgi:hypothetical protein